MKLACSILIGLAVTTAAHAQQPDPIAYGQEIMECVGSKVQLRSRILQLEAELANLKAAKPADTPAKPPDK